jgi:hypothetical protein
MGGWDKAVYHICSALGEVDELNSWWELEETGFGHSGKRRKSPGHDLGR